MEVDGESQESVTDKQTVATAPLSPSLDLRHRPSLTDEENDDDNNNEEEDGIDLTAVVADDDGVLVHNHVVVPSSSSTLSSCMSMPVISHSHDEQDDVDGSNNRIHNTCSSPYQAFLFSSEWLGATNSHELQLPDISAGENTNGANNDDADSVTSGAYFAEVDLDSRNWMKAISSVDAPTFGFAILAVATALVHPVLFVAGAMTAFGVVHAMGAGWDYCSPAAAAAAGNDNKDSSGKLFDAAAAKEKSTAVAASWEQTLLSVCYKDLSVPKAEEALPAENNSSELLLPDLKSNIEAEAIAGAHSLEIVPVTITTATAAAAEASAPEERQQRDAPTTTKPPRSSPFTPRRLSLALKREMVEQLYPPLGTSVVKDVAFPGLHAIEFFRVFFADDAPYNFMELQKQRGDLDIVYGEWEPLGPADPILLYDNTNIKSSEAQVAALIQATTPAVLRQAHDDKSKAPFQKRVLTFKAKTNNFLGPVYATTRKTQRVLLHHKTMVVMEMRTDLKDIPFADKFYVLERWVIRASKEKVPPDSSAALAAAASGRKEKFKYVSTLEATSQVVFTGSCQFAGQIKTKSAATIQELVTCWCTMAKEALKLTEERKLMRLQHELEEEEEEEADSDCEETELDDNDDDDDVPEHDDDCSSRVKENIPPSSVSKSRHDDEEGIEVSWPNDGSDTRDDHDTSKHATKRRILKHSGSLPLPSIGSYRGGRTLQGLKRSVSSLWNKKR